MNLYQLAEKMMTEKSIWASGESVVVFENSGYKVHLKRNQYGKIIMFVINRKKVDTRLVNINLDLGYIGSFHCTLKQYGLWTKQVQNARGA